jgi:hypothetical protein
MEQAAANQRLHNISQALVSYHSVLSVYKQLFRDVVAQMYKRDTKQEMQQFRVRGVLK